MNTISTKRVYFVAVVSLVLGILFDYLFYDKQIGISFLIYEVLLLAGLFCFLFAFKIRPDKAVFLFLPAILFFALMVGIRDNIFLLFWNVVMTIGLMLLMAHQIIGRKINQILFLDYLKTAVIVPFSMLGKSIGALGRIIAVGKGNKENQKTSQIAKGILITLPIALAFLFLLTSADLVFKKLLTNLFSFNFSINPDVVAQIWWAAFFAFLWLGVYIYILENAGQPKNSEPDLLNRIYKFGNIEAGILFTTLNVLFLSFVIIQIKYLFAGHGAITQFGYTYAEYAHKGFGELIAVAVVTFALVFLAEKHIERSENKPNRLFKILTCILMLLVIVIMASAFTRLGIYEQAYGFTLLRLLVQAFIIWLAVVFLWLTYKIIRNTKDRPFIFGIFLSVVTFFVVFNLFNPDAFVAKKNINQFVKTGALDTKYLSTLSADVVPDLMPLLAMPQIQDKYGNQLAIEIAFILKNFYDLSAKQPWQSYNLSRIRAIELINSQWGLISTLAQKKLIN
ncbi:MAG: DUF4173 domain-containing protein [Patescibacteria group bacterium]|jgi:hypothetical protein